MQCVNISDPLTSDSSRRRSVDPSSPSSDSMSTSAFSTISALDMYSNNIRFFIAKDAGVGFSFPFPSTRSDGARTQTRRRAQRRRRRCASSLFPMGRRRFAQCVTGRTLHTDGRVRQRAQMSPIDSHRSAVDPVAFWRNRKISAALSSKTPVDRHRPPKARRPVEDLLASVPNASNAKRHRIST